MRLILFFTFGLSLKKWAEGGMLYREVAFYNELTKKGIDIVFLTYGDDTDFGFTEIIKGIKVIPVYSITKKPKLALMRFLKSFFLPFMLKNVLKEADIYKTNQMWGSWVAVIAKLLYRKRLLVRCGYEQFRFALMMNMPFYFKFISFFNSLFTYWIADAIIISSEIGKKFINKTFMIPLRKITLNYNYIDTDLFKPIPLDERRNRLLFVGRLEKEKNLYNLLDAVKNTPYGLDIAGQGRLKNNVESYITKNDINARLLGVIPNEKLPELYNRYPVYILPSLCEGMPKTLLEAMSSGRAVIASDIDEISSLVVNGESGLLCKTDKESISSAILTVMEDVDLRRKFGAAARKFILDNCSLSKIIEKEVLLYK